MCFRPADSSAAGPAACPECGKTLQALGGITLKKCPFCNADLAGGPQMSAPAAPGAPAPAAPGAPKPPAAPVAGEKR